MSSPIKINLKTEIFSVLMIILSIVAAIYFYAHFPDRIASHWNFQGTVDGWSSKTFGVLFGPVLLIAMYLLFLALPYFDPKRDRYQEFAKTYSIFKNIFLFFFLIIYLITGLVNLGFNINVGVVTPVMIGILFVILGNYMGKIKQNWFMGIRTPWTLSSENVWNKTHRVGGWAFMLMGIAFILMPIMPGFIVPFVFIAVISIAVLGTFFYSYWVYRKEKPIDAGPKISETK